MLVGVAAAVVSASVGGNVASGFKLLQRVLARD